MGKANQKVKISCPSYTIPPDPMLSYMMMEDDGGLRMLIKEKP